MRRAAAGLAALVMTVAFAGVSHASPAKHVRTYDKNMLKYVNQARVADGRKPYKESARLYAIAKSRAEILVKDDAVGHPPNLSQQIAAKCPRATTNGENSGEQGRTSAKQMFTLYMSDPFHRGNILSPKFTDVGIASIAIPNGDGTNSEWDVMDFANHCD